VNNGSSSSGQSDCIEFSKTQLQDVVSAVHVSQQAAGRAGKLAIAAAQAFLGEKRKLETFSSNLTEILKRA